MTDAELGPAARQLYQSAVLLHRQNRLGEARERYLAALEASPGHPAILSGLGVVHVHLGDVEKAADAFASAAAAAPGDAGVRNYLGLTLARLGRYDEAAAAFDSALRIEPGLFEALIGLGQAFLKTGRFEEARDAFTKALERRPAFAAALMGLGDALDNLGRQSEARKAYEQLLARDPNNAAAHWRLGSVLKQFGLGEEAHDEYTRAVSLAPVEPAYHRALAESAPFTDGDARLAPLEQLARNQDRLSDRQKAELHFALAKAYDDLKRHQDAFRHLEQGNRIYRGLVPYEESEVFAFFGEIVRIFTAEAIAARRGKGHPSDVPVFVVGMPRSGTTLVEQILASHPAVFGAGERLYTQDLILAGHAGRNYPTDFATLPDAALRDFGGRYAARLQALAPEAERIVDKLPANFRHLGLLHLALPGAKFIHVRRDPLDTCLSCYSKLFASGLNYTYDLGELGRYYKAYEALMAHWRAVLPEGVMLEVAYESLVADLEGEARRLVAYCDLGWDERCLRFFEAARAVRTLSEMQVRQPLFTTSVGRWQAYASWLQPLRDALR
ncbi:MAG: sulfotransferase [Alphaproteobacteria bacterium]|nr:sulfotransferase [Alphaproteobacteria bacterium]